MKGDLFIKSAFGLDEWILHAAPALFQYLELHMRIVVGEREWMGCSVSVSMSGLLLKTCHEVFSWLRWSPDAGNRFGNTSCVSLSPTVQVILKWVSTKEDHTGVPEADDVLWSREF